ncbi:ComEA family DNA-binding protein [Zobellia barbeyronii]|uniref:Helix-hairpin-helix domain-containing protein n=1 Tax=Zobellia barbeyronii TaxID=2748009 RepID=A0ABS5WEK4_9FLAO|nr:helix-hairpin-helix domain-containing protein [Zobellia barbeyronii]MBT2161813.1 helix-hairpin-helix domain-containing protein [Zobellia barbeyronii]
MKNFKSHFRFNKQERSGVFYLLFIIVILQVTYFVLRSSGAADLDNSFMGNEQLQTQIDSLKAREQLKDSVKIYPFNPNYITDYKGYTLGLSVEEIDRLHDFRKDGKFANSAEDFQKVTQVSDSLLQVISPYFKFPEWAQRKSKSTTSYKTSSTEQERGVRKAESKYAVSDLNSATIEELQEISGIGEKLSARIVKFRDRLGGFLVNEQLYDVYGLEPEVVERTLKRFQVLKKPVIEKININTASAKNLSKLVYLQKDVSESIVNYRSDNRTILSFDELSKIENFPFEKIDRIKLYLTL